MLWFFWASFQHFKEIVKSNSGLERLRFSGNYSVYIHLIILASQLTSDVQPWRESLALSAFWLESFISMLHGILEIYVLDFRFHRWPHRDIIFNPLWLFVFKIWNLILLFIYSLFLFNVALHSFMKILIRDENLSAQTIGLDRNLWILERVMEYFKVLMSCRFG